MTKEERIARRISIAEKVASARKKCLDAAWEYHDICNEERDIWRDDAVTEQKEKEVSNA